VAGTRGNQAQHAIDAQAGIPACWAGAQDQNETMDSALWIAIGAAVIVVLAHIGLFWWFICKGNKKPPSD
jgi:hypothetical protein